MTTAKETALTILIVEPSATMRSVYASHCQGRGAEVEYASDVAEAIASVTQRAPAAIITVNELPGLNGNSLVAALKSCPDYCEIPILMLTPAEVATLGHYQPDHVLVKDGNMRAALDEVLSSIGLGVMGLASNDEDPDQFPPGTRVLLAEDNVVNQTVVGRILHVAGAEVVTAINGAEAAAEAMREEFSVVLMDIQMPTLDGYQATRLLRSSNYNGPIVALTGEEEDRFQEHEESAMFDAVLFKPVERAKLLATVFEQLGKTRAAEGAS